MPCPYCGAEKTYSNRFQIKRSLTRAQWHCFYCGQSGEAESTEEPTPEQEQLAREQLRKQQRWERQRRTREALKLWDEAEPS
jgi:ATP-dependent exoDNAse (exonuclease V) beta subunit